VNLRQAHFQGRHSAIKELREWIAHEVEWIERQSIEPPAIEADRLRAKLYEMFKESGGLNASD